MSVTPMMAQYMEIKEAHPNALLFYRMGDFYEMFFEDAVNAAAALDIALTKRGKHNGDDIPMCGVPVHSAEGYLLTLIRKGFRVAVCEQLESPAEAKKRGSKSVVKRDVVRLVTPGTLTEDTLLEARRHNFLSSFATIRDEAALAWVDISTGSFHVMQLSAVELGPELARLAPAELIVSDTIETEFTEISDDFGISLAPIARSAFNSDSAKGRLCELFKVNNLDGFGQFARSELAAMGGLITYLELTQKGKLPLLRQPLQETRTMTVQIDAATRRNLELTSVMSGGRAGSLLSVVDRTVTAAGARLLERRLSSPSRQLETVQNRHETVAFCLESRDWRNSVRHTLRKVPDLDRALSRLSLDRGGPRDLAAIRNALSQADIIAACDLDVPNLLQDALRNLAGHDDLVDHLDAALVAEPPLLARDGGFIATGFHEQLDEARKLRDEGRSIIASKQQDYITQSGVSSLKIKHNNVLGYFIETPATHADKMMSPEMSETFIHRQTTANQVRFTTVELSELETKILNSANHALEIEKHLFETLRSSILEVSAEIAQTSRGIAEIDLSMALAELAETENWCRPKMDNSRAFEIEAGRHPVVEPSLKRQNGGNFIANDCCLSGETDAHIWLLTGPNMAGKSTFLRQNALIAILAQAGSFVPATAAHIGLVSQVFSRVGASDDLARGRSTFMVEMVETAAILNQADDRALILLDEIGRGTATYDGLSIAWATLEHLHDVNKSRALFATHYHEMTSLAAKLVGVDNATVSVREWEGEIVFLHEVKRGAADRSYGVQVAQLAGLPQSVINRARVVLDTLENGEREGTARQSSILDDLPLFSAAPTSGPQVQTSPVLDMLDDIHPDELTPKDALDVLYKLKAAAT